MKEFVISEAKAETAVLVGLITPQQDEAKTEEYLDELEFLADTAGAVTIKRFTQRVNGPSSVTYVGSGKLQEIREYIEAQEKAYDEWNEELHYPEEGDGPQPVGHVKPLAALAAFSKSAVRSLCCSGIAHSGPASPNTDALVARPPSAYSSNSLFPLMKTVTVFPSCSAIASARAVGSPVTSSTSVCPSSPTIFM